MRIAVIRQGYFPYDPRVRREVLALAGAGHDVQVICLGEPGRPWRERIDGVGVLRIPLPHRRSPGRARYVLQYLAFALIAAVVLGALHLRRRFALVQVHSLPDTLVFAAIVPKLLGARVVLDLHEMMVEFCESKFGCSDDSRLIRVVAAAEQASIRFADFSLTCTNEMRDRFVERGADRTKLGVVLNAADEDVFDPDRLGARSADDEFVLISHGSVEERYGIDTAIRAVAMLRDELPDVRLDIVGAGSYLPTARRLVTALRLEGIVRFSGGWVPLPELLDALVRADAGVVAMKRDAFRDLTHCNKMYDLVTMRLPVVISRTRSVENYFGESSFEYFDSDDPADLARAIRRVHGDPSRRAALVAGATAALEPYRWPAQREIYLGHIDRVLRG